MNTANQHESNPEKAMSSYVVGFILSLVFTFIPYILVVRHYVTGQALLITILTFAMVQLLVQVFFFLHLGRETGPKWNLYFFIGTFVAMLIVVVGSVIIISNLHSNMTTLDQTKRIIDSEGIYQVSGERTGACRTLHTNHVVVIQDGKVNPSLTVALKCDTLTFIDKDTVDVQLNFGTRSKRAPFAGLTGIALRKEHTKTITLSQTGTFSFYDNGRPSVTGSFAVVGDK